MLPGSGLCGSCRFARRVESRRGSAFWLCRRSEDDRRFPRYPVLPVLTCPGHEPPAPTRAAANDDPPPELGGEHDGPPELESRLPEGDP